MSLKTLTSIHSFRLRRLVATKGALGGQSLTRTNVGNIHKGRFQHRTTSHHRELFDERNMDFNYIMYSCVDLKIDKDDISQYEILGVSPTWIADKKFEIVGFSNPDELGRFWRFALTEPGYNNN